MNNIILRQMQLVIWQLCSEAAALYFISKLQNINK